MNLKLFLLLPSFMLNACAINPSFSPENHLTLEYMQTADPIADAKGAIYNKNFTLIGFDQRGLVIPGLNNNAIGNCHVKRIAEMGDVIRSPEQLAQRKKVQAYSKAYNLEILKASSCQQQPR